LNMATKTKKTRSTRKPAISKGETGSSGKASGKFQPGKSGNPAGRKPGSKNKRTLLLRELCAEKNFNPIEFLIEVAQNKEIEWGTRIKAACEINSCLNPKLKAIEHSGGLNGKTTKELSEEDLMAIASEGEK
jgi:hypothetical protein